MKHTPGEWTKERNPFFEFKSDYRYSINAENVNPAIVFGKSFDEAEANAKLIAAAPELLEALQESLSFINYNKQVLMLSDGRTVDLFIKISEAIQKATQ